MRKMNVYKMCIWSEGHQLFISSFRFSSISGGFSIEFKIEPSKSILWSTEKWNKNILSFYCSTITDLFVIEYSRVFFSKLFINHWSLNLMKIDHSSENWLIISFTEATEWIGTNRSIYSIDFFKLKHFYFLRT